jgi:hypothetical protein
MKIFTKSRDGMLYSAIAEYKNGHVTVLKGSKINRINSPGFKPKKLVADLRADNSLFDAKGILLSDIQFNSLSTAATFVTGRIANGMIVWKTQDSKYIRYSLEGGKRNGN